MIKLQSYSDKMKVVMKSMVKFSEMTCKENHPLLVSNVDFFTLEELDKICKLENVIAVQFPHFMFDLNTMTVSYLSNGHADENMTYCSRTYVVFCEVKEILTQSVDEMIDYIDSNKDNLYFFYSGFRVENTCKFRMYMIDGTYIESFVKRYEAITNLSKYLNMNTSVADIRKYVKSAEFTSDIKLAKTDIDELGKEYQLSLEKANIKSETDVLPSLKEVTNSINDARIYS